MIEARPPHRSGLGSGLRRGSVSRSASESASASALVSASTWASKIDRNESKLGTYFVYRPQLYRQGHCHDMIYPIYLDDMVQKCPTIYWQTDASHSSGETAGEKDNGIRDLGGIDCSVHRSLFCSALNEVV